MIHSLPALPRRPAAADLPRRSAEFARVETATQLVCTRKGRTRVNASGGLVLDNGGHVRRRCVIPVVTKPVGLTPVNRFLSSAESPQEPDRGRGAG